MLELIGVEHYCKAEADAVFSYVTDKYPTLNSIMLELDANNRPFHSDRSTSSEISYFDYLKNRFDERNIRIIPGDLYQVEAFWANFGYLIGSCEEKKATEIIVTRRNDAMKDILQRENPDVPILGIGHTIYLKGLHPEVYHSFFSSGNIFRIDQKKLVLRRDDIYPTLDELFTVGFALCGTRDLLLKNPKLRITQI